MKKYFLLFTLFFVLTSCYSSEISSSLIWEMDRAHFKSLILDKDFDFLKSFDFDNLGKKGKLSEIYRLDKGAAFYLSFIFEELGMEEAQLKFLGLELEHGFWKKEALLKINKILSSENQWPNLIGYLEFYLYEIEPDPEVTVHLIKALYKNEEYHRAVLVSDSDFSSYYSILSLLEVEDPGWEKIIKEYVYNKGSINQIEEIYQLLQEKNLFDKQDESLKFLISGISAYSNANYKKSKLFFKELDLDSSILNQFPSLIYKIRLPVQKAGLAINWAKIFEGKSQWLSKRSAFASSFVSARLYQSARDFENSDKMFRRAIENASSEYEEDRAIWYLMNLYKHNMIYLSGLIEEFAPMWSDPYYFEDILTEYLSVVSARGDWQLFSNTFNIVDEFGDKETLAAFSWVKYLAIDSGYIADSNPLELLQHMKSSRHMGFYYLMGTLLSGSDSIIINDMVPDNSFSDYDRLITGAIDFGLEELALSYTLNREKSLSKETLRKTSVIASELGNSLRSIQLINYVYYRDGHRVTEEDLKLLYPEKYQDSISANSKANGFPKELLLGIIRTESAFTPDIISHSGAVGLSQLMPATANEQARKLNISNPDLTDPETNIYIGSSYIKWIMERPWTDNLSQMLIAYNAGGGNLRKWKKTYPLYREELFTEIIPYKETRNYVKKVLTSSIIYGFVYNDIKPEDTVRMIYPDFNNLKIINN